MKRTENLAFSVLFCYITSDMYGRSGVDFSPQIPRKRKARNTKNRKNPTEQMAKTWALFLIASCLMIKDKTDIRMEYTVKARPI